MKPEQNQNSSPENLTSRQKLLRRVAAPLAAIAALGALHHGVSGDKDPQPELPTTVTAEATITTKFGGEEDGWGHGAATRAIQEAVNHGAAIALEEAGAPADTDVQAIVKTLPVYEQAGQALDMANQNEIIPDANDKLTISVEVKADSEKNVSYKVIDAEIEDIPNNQE